MISMFTSIVDVIFCICKKNVNINYIYFVLNEMRNVSQNA